MGENEQGGMLRVVVVLGLIALIAGVVIGGVVYAKNNMQNRIAGTASLVDKAIKDNKPVPSIAESDVPADAWQVYDMSKTYTVRSGDHIAVRLDEDVSSTDENGGSVSTKLLSYVELVPHGADLDNTESPLVINGVHPHTEVTLDGHAVKSFNFQDIIAEKTNGQFHTYKDYLEDWVHKGQLDDDSSSQLPVPADGSNATMSLGDYLKWFQGLSDDEKTQFSDHEMVNATSLGMGVELSSSVEGQIDVSVNDSADHHAHEFMSTTVSSSSQDLSIMKDMVSLSDAIGWTNPSMYKWGSANDLDSDQVFDVYDSLTYGVAPANAQIAIW